MNTMQYTTHPITAERMEAAKASLEWKSLDSKRFVRDYLNNKDARDIIAKWDGKKITRRLYAQLAEAWHVEKSELTDGSVYFPALGWEEFFKFLDGTRNYIIRVELGHDTSARVYVKAKAGRGVLDAAATLAEWDKTAEAWLEGAERHARAEAMLDNIVSEYNAIQERIVSLLNNLGEDAGLAMDALRGKVYERLHDFCEVETNLRG